MFRKKMSNRKSRRMFSKHASHPHPKNFRGMPMRGGIRL